MPHLTLPSGRLHYRIDGPSGAPWVVLHHALGTDLTLWSECDALAARYRVLRFDARGHGKSDAPQGPYSLEALSRDVLALMDGLDVARAHVCGISIGGLVAMWLGVHAADRVDKLVLCNTAPRIGTAESWDERIAEVSRGGLAPLVPGALERWFTPDFRARAPARVAAIGEALAQTSQHGYIGCCTALRDADLRADIARTRAETLVVTGTHDPVTTPAHARAMVETLHKADYLELPAAHLTCVESGAALTERLLSFFD